MSKIKKIVSSNLRGTQPVLDLQCMELNELPNEVFNLVHLQELYLGVFKSNQENLEYWYAVADWSNANEISFIPSNISKLSNLTKLSLSLNPISDFSFLQYLPSLRSLDLGELNESCYDDFKSPIELEVLSCVDRLQCINLYGSVVENINFLAKKDHLLHLDLRTENNCDISCIEGKSIKALNVDIDVNENMEVVKTLLGLKQLVVYSISQIDLFVIAKLTNLDTLYIHTHETLDCSILLGLKNLRRLKIYSYKAKGLSVVKHFEQLEYLDLSSNGIREISWLSSLNKLKYLDLRDNHLVKGCISYNIEEVYI